MMLWQAAPVYITCLKVIVACRPIPPTANCPRSLEAGLAVASNVFSILFTIELAVKLPALGPVEYLRSVWNVFDLLVVAISLVEMAMQLIGGAMSSDLRCKGVPWVP